MSRLPFRRKTSRLVDWLFRSRTTGEITIAQLPNAPLWIFLGAIALRQFLPTGNGLRTAVSWLGTAALTWWAVDEMLRGVNPWRRCLGLAGCIVVVKSLLDLLGSAT